MRAEIALKAILRTHTGKPKVKNKSATLDKFTRDIRSTRINISPLNRVRNGYMVTICFQLSMPSNNSWNGKWTGDSVFYARTRSLSKDKAAAVLKEGHYSYSFGDGWIARVDVKSITSAQRRAIDKNTKGFCGYDWMIDSIIKHGDIYAGEPKAKTA